jgi:hypothetical protein
MDVQTQVEQSFLALPGEDREAIISLGTTLRLSYTACGHKLRFLRLASFPHAFGGNPAISVGLDARHAQRASAAKRRVRRKRSGMTAARVKPQIVPARSISQKATLSRREQGAVL